MTNERLHIKLSQLNSWLRAFATFRLGAHVLDLSPRDSKIFKAFIQRSTISPRIEIINISFYVPK